MSFEDVLYSWHLSGEIAVRIISPKMFQVGYCLYLSQTFYLNYPGQCWRSVVYEESIACVNTLYINLVRRWRKLCECDKETEVITTVKLRLLLNAIHTALSLQTATTVYIWGLGIDPYNASIYEVTPQIRYNMVPFCHFLNAKEIRKCVL